MVRICYVTRRVFFVKINTEYIWLRRTWGKNHVAWLFWRVVVILCYVYILFTILCSVFSIKITIWQKHSNQIIAMSLQRIRKSVLNSQLSSLLFPVSFLFQRPSTNSVLWLQHYRCACALRWMSLPDKVSVYGYFQSVWPLRRKSRDTWGRDRGGHCTSVYVCRHGTYDVDAVNHP